MTTPERRGDGDDAAMRDRLASLTRDLSASGASPKKETGLAGPRGIGQAMNLGFRVMSEFVAAVAVGGFIGWLIDKGLGSSPFGLILFIALGTAAGFWGVYRVAMGPGAK